jgi:homoserine kinase type II
MAILTKLSRKGFKEILDNYDIGEYKYHKHVPIALANTIYILNTTKGKYVLKVFERQNHYHIRYQIKIRDYLNKNKFPVSETLFNKRHKKIFRYNNKNIIIEKFVEGIHIKHVNYKLAKHIGITLAVLHNLLYKLKLSGGYFWGKNHQFKKQNHPEKFAGLKVKEEYSKLLKDMKSIDRKKLKESIIQCDFHTGNLLVKNNQITAVVDWEDAHKDYLCYDLGICISSIFIYSSGIRKQLKDFLEGYQSVRKLNNEEKKAVYYFALTRKLGVLGYLSAMKKHHKTIKTGPGSWADHVAKSYIMLRKLPINKFLEYF